MSLVESDRPWFPFQLLAASALFGPGAAGVVTGINFKRLGEPQYQISCGIIGFVLFIIEVALVVTVIPDKALRPFGFIFNSLVGGGFMLFQKPYFDAWKAANFKPATEKEQYRPNRIGLLFLVGLICLAIQLAILFAAFAMMDSET